MKTYFVTVQVTVEVEGFAHEQAAADYVSSALYKTARRIGQDAPTVEVTTVEDNKGRVYTFD